MVEKGHRYHHIGLPTKQHRNKEDYNEEWKFYGSGYFESQFGIEWLRFEEDTPIHPLIQTIPHVAFITEDIQQSIKDQHVIYGPHSPADGVVVCFIEFEGTPIEFLQFDKPEQEVWPNPKKRIHANLDPKRGNDTNSYRYHHFEIISETVKNNMIYKEQDKSFVSDLEKHPFCVQWVKYAVENRMPSIIKDNSMIVFSVRDLNSAITEHKVIVDPYRTVERVLTAIIEENGALVKLVERLERF